jgi:regulator of sirC expression with transglutaminase-like and TPR domain
LLIRINEKKQFIEEKKYEIALSLVQDIINLKPSRKRKITKP